MKEQKVKSIYGLRFPVKIVVKKEEEPLHWHKDLEILCILKGKVKLQMNNAFYELQEDDIFLINSEDLHSVMIETEKSIYLSLDIDLMYYEKFFMEMEYIVFIDDDSINSAENSALSRDIKRRLAQMLIEIKNKNVDYQNRIIYNASSLLAVLIDNYNVVKKNSKTFKNKDQFSRIWKAYEYMYNNYNRRITLEEVANYVHVSKSHLSHIIKSTMGLSFERLLNQTRAEQSMKFLLTTDKSITKISEECGFSDPKYFKNFFLQFFHCTPLEYRNRNRHNVSETEFETTSYFETIKFNDLLNHKISQYLEEQMKEGEDNEIDLTIDFFGRKEAFNLKKDWKKEIIITGNKYKASFWNTDRIKMLQQEIGFEYMYIMDVLHSNFIEYLPGKPVKIDWNELDRLIEEMKEMKAYPKLGFMNKAKDDEIFMNLIQKFLFHYRLKYNDIEMSKWKLVFSLTKEEGERNFKSMIEEVVHSITENIGIEFEVVEANKQESSLKQVDASGISLLRDILIHKKRIDNYLEVLLDQRGLKSNLYFVYSLLNKLGTQVIMKGDNYIVTKDHNKLAILIFHCKEDNMIKQEAALNIINLKGKRYLFKQYSLYSQQEKTETYIKNVTEIDYISEEDIKSINWGRYPDLCIEFFESFESIHRSLTVFQNRAELFTLERVL